MTTFGQFISERRKALRLTQTDVATAIGIVATLLNDIENDRSDPRQGDFLMRIADVLQLDVPTLMDMANAHLEHQRLRKQIEEDEFRSLAAYRLSRE